MVHLLLDIECLGRDKAKRLSYKNLWQLFPCHKIFKYIRKEQVTSYILHGLLFIALKKNKKKQRDKSNEIHSESLSFVILSTEAFT